MTLGESQTEFDGYLSFDLAAKEGETLTADQKVAYINRARRIFNTRRYQYDPFLPWTLVAGVNTYGFQSGSFAKRVLEVQGGWLDHRPLCLVGRKDFEDSYPTWPFASPGNPKYVCQMDKSLVLHRPPTQTFIDAAARLTSSRAVFYRVNLFSASGSTYKLTFNGQETSGLGPNASAASILSALNALSNVDSGDMYVTLVDGVRHIYDVKIVTGAALNDTASLTITSNTLTGGSSTATCQLQSAFVKARVVENDMTAGVEDDVELPEPFYTHDAICELASIVASRHGINDDEAWRRLGAMNSGVVDLIETEARESKMSYLDPSHRIDWRSR